ncbi:MAG: hypothetical protein J6Y92_09185 [Lentisphaeria bacterium]|nr:hypothetical protein [Lentisphaeria bacterium]
MNISKTGMKVIFIIVLLLILLPLALFVLVQFAPPKEAPAQNEAGIADSSETRSVTVRARQTRRENRVAKQETVVIEPDPAPVWEIGAISTDPMRMTKQATPYEPGTVPGDSGVMVQYAGSPDDMMSGPQPLPPDDPWGGAILPPMTPENMR